MQTMTKAPTPADFDHDWTAYYAAHKVWSEQRAAEAAKRWTYAGLDAWLTGRNKDSRKVARNTYLRRRGDSIAVTLHGTDVVTYHPDGSITLNSGGWKTMTTKDRIDRFTPAWLRVSSDKGVWHVLVRDMKADSYWSGKSYRFFDGITFGPKGGCRNPMPLTKAQREDDFNKDIDKKIKAYVNGWIAEARSGEMPLPSNGDCWFCLMFPETEHEDESHLLGHLEERYYVPSLIMKAATAKRYSNPQYHVMLVQGLRANEDQTHFDGERVNDKEIRRLLTWYLRKHLRTNMAPPR